MKQTKQTFSPHNRRVVGHSPVLFPASHALFIHRPVQLTLGWEDGLMVDDNCLNDLVNVGLAGHGVLVIWYWHQRRTKANGQIVGVHHVLVTVLRQTGGQAQSSHLAPASSEPNWWAEEARRDLLIQKRKQVSHDDDDGPLKSHGDLLQLMSSFSAGVELWSRTEKVWEICLSRSRIFQILLKQKKQKTLLKTQCQYFMNKDWNAAEFMHAKTLLI